VHQSCSQVFGPELVRLVGVSVSASRLGAASWPLRDIVEVLHVDYPN